MKRSMTIPRPTDTSPVAQLFEAHELRQSLEEVFNSKVTAGDRRPAALAPILRSALARPARRKITLARLPEISKPQTLTVDEIEGTLTNFLQSLDVERVGTITLALPFGMDHYLVNAATFKALAGREEDTLLRRAGVRWEIVENDELIDLGDRTQLFRMGRVQIFS
ncbi:MAG: hypothetical protein ABSA41_11950 [Terriglobia bacterium]